MSPGQDKLTFSTLFKMKPQGKVIDTWLGKSIICLTAQLTYNSVRQVLVNSLLTQEIKVETDGVSVNQVLESTNALGQISRQLISVGEFMFLANLTVTKAK
ncbi:hypothetical protein H4Q26_006304 [Puccinia striiformis f. sp. tritici PST-130]|uniref:RNB domain-containing protein n=1 Tax=Puccinia striiformis f. sp. tritici PST-78 TaxID=1165861 RepID=A0A0L0VE55_9BASI|nr:hypothetical protein H4Q26_006304 [Puccinia striiformis f. sp. tritici PST-130]KNE97279.1 hypothetical protein PSTG_09388 [Puccinia striiformis f. sp. tritici PST-78]